jgi:hypothetical protein
MPFGLQQVVHRDRRHLAHLVGGAELLDELLVDDAVIGCDLST